MIPVFLGVFEALVHIVGIKLHRMSKPYTPGLVTALLLLAMSIYSLIVFSKNGITGGSDYVLGFLCMLICFAVMQRTVISIFGLGYKDIIAMAKTKFKR